MPECRRPPGVGGPAGAVGGIRVFKGMIIVAWRNRLMVGGSLIGLLAGCTLSSDMTKPPAPIPVAYEGPAPAGPAVSPTWWRNFGSPELDRLMDQALANNFDIAVAVAKIEEADAQVRQTGSALLPTVDLSASGTRKGTPRSQSSSTFSRGGSGDIVTNTLSASLSASYTVDFFGQNRAALEAARQTAQATRYDRDVVALSTMASVADTYFTILSLQDRLQYAQGNLSIAEHVLAVINARVGVGTASDLDVAQQQSVVDAERATIPILQNSLRQQENALAILVGRLPEANKVAGGSLNALNVPTVSPGLPSTLLARRPDIAEAEANLAAADANVVAARAAFFPSIDLTADGGFESTALRSLFDPASTFFSLAASVSQPVFHGFKLQGALQFEQATYRQLAVTYLKSVVSAFQDVENGLTAVDREAEAERLQARTVAADQLAYRISEARLREGIIDITTVLNTQKTLFGDQDTLAQDRLAHLEAVVSLYQALGGGWPHA